jgi:outer membrane protein TolC
MAAMLFIPFPCMFFPPRPLTVEFCFIWLQLCTQILNMKILAAFVVLIVVAQIMDAQVTFSTLDEILRFADKNSLVAKQSDLQTRISAKDEVINKSGLLPKVNVFGTADYYPILATQLIPEAIFGGSPDKFRKVQFGLPYIFSAGAEFTMPLVNFEKWEQLKRFKLQTQQTKLQTEVNKENLHIQIIQWYYQTLLSHEMVKLAQSNENVANELMRIMELRKQSQVLNPADYNRSKNLQLDVRTSKVEYEKMYEQSLNNLHHLLNLSDTVQIKLTDSVNTMNWQTIGQANTVTDRPAWKESQAQIAVAEQQLSEIQKSAYPKISFDGKYTNQWQVKPSTDQHINFDFSNVGVHLDFPLFQGNYYRASRQKTEMQLQLAKVSQQQTAADLGQQQADWWSNYSAAVKKDVLLTQKKEVSADNLRIAQLNVKEGVMEFEEFNNIFQEYNKATIDWLQNLSDGIVYKILLSQK